MRKFPAIRYLKSFTKWWISGIPRFLTLPSMYTCAFTVNANQRINKQLGSVISVGMRLPHPPFGFWEVWMHLGTLESCGGCSTMHGWKHKHGHSWCKITQVTDDMCDTIDLGCTSLHAVSNEPGSWLIRELEYLTDLSLVPTQQVPPSRVCKT